MKKLFPNYSFEFFIAKRYLHARRKTGFINSYISIAGVTIGVAALIIVLSVMNGFEEEVRSRIIGFDTHVRLRKWHQEPVDEYRDVEKMIEHVPHIVGISPYITEKALIRNLHHAKYSDGVMVRGTDPDRVTQVSDLANCMIDGELNLNPTGVEGKGYPSMLIGRYLADRLYLSVGDTALLISLSGFSSMFQMPPMQPFIITGIFEFGFYEFDNTYLYISTAAAQKLFQYGDAVSGIEIRLDNLYAAKEVVKKIEHILGFPFTAETWFELRQNLFSWMQLEKMAAFLVLCLIIIVAASNVVSVLFMLVIEKTREIGILKSVGANAKTILRIFLFEGLVVGFLGTLGGNIIGLGLCFIQYKYKLLTLPGDVYFIPSLPIKTEPLDIVFISIASILICLIAAIYPASKASKLDPVEAIRYE